MAKHDIWHVPAVLLHVQPAKQPRLFAARPMKQLSFPQQFRGQVAQAAKAIQIPVIRQCLPGAMEHEVHDGLGSKMPEPAVWITDVTLHPPDGFLGESLPLPFPLLL